MSKLCEQCVSNLQHQKNIKSIPLIGFCPITYQSYWIKSAIGLGVKIFFIRHTSRVVSQSGRETSPPLMTGMSLMSPQEFLIKYSKGVNALPHKDCDD